MKCIAFISFIILTIIIVLSANFVTETKTVDASQFLRIHIRANSNETSDQVVKYEIKNKVVEMLSPILVSCSSKEDVIEKINLHKEQIEQVSNQILVQYAFCYETKMIVKTEYFPTRMYDNVVLESGRYDAIILELGEAEGNNWWCVVYPPLCFVNNGENVNIVYKSKLVELIKNFFK